MDCVILLVLNYRNFGALKGGTTRNTLHDEQTLTVCNEHSASVLLVKKGD
jgi:hypothetical protein